MTAAAARALHVVDGDGIPLCRDVLYASSVTVTLEALRDGADAHAADDDVDVCNTCAAEARRRLRGAT